MPAAKNLRCGAGGIMWVHVGKSSSPLDHPGAVGRVLARGPVAGGSSARDRNPGPSATRSAIRPCRSRRCRARSAIRRCRASSAASRPKRAATSGPSRERAATSALRPSPSRLPRRRHSPRCVHGDSHGDASHGPYLVTGGAGFIGSSIARALIARGDGVRILDNFSTGKRENLADIAERIELLEGDIRDDATAGARDRRASRWCSTRRRSRRCRSRWPSRSRTTPSTRRARCACSRRRATPGVRRRRLRRVVGGLRRRPRRCPRSRRCRRRRSRPTARRKLAGEVAMQVYARAFGLETGLPALLQRVRPAPGSEVRVRGRDPEVHHRGAGGASSRASSATASSRATSATSTTSSRRTSPRRRRTRARASGGVFNIGCGEAIDLNRVVALIGDILGQKLEAVHEPERAGDIKHSWGDVGAARAALGFRGAVSFSDGLRRTIEWYKSQVVNSMTGFGRASVEAGERRLRVEIRSVNHRGLDLKIRGTESGRLLRRRESGARCGPRSNAARSRCTCATSPRAARRASTRGGSARRTPCSSSLRQELEIEEPVGPAHRRRVHDRGRRARALEGEALWEALRPAVDGGAGGADRARDSRRAGRWRPTSARTGTRLVELAARLRQATRPLADRFARRLTERLDAFRGQPGFEPGRIAQEAALMADRLDVSEELVRLETHLAHAGELVAAPRARSAASSTSSSRRSAASSTPSPRRRRTPAWPGW